MGAWAKVTTEPLGLAGFALFLIFLYIGRVRKDDKRKWLPAVAFACAAATLVGGFVLAYLQATKPVLSPDSGNRQGGAALQQTNQVDQSSSGAGSPNVQGVQGDVTVTVDQSDGKTKVSKGKSKP
jgi:hypothetical protein